MVDQDSPGAAPQDGGSTATTTEWCVWWPGDPEQGGGEELRADEQDARRVVRINGGGEVMSRTVTTTRGPWRVA